MLQRLNSAVSILLSNVLPLCATSTAVAPGLVLLLMNCTTSLATSLQGQHRMTCVTILDLFPTDDRPGFGGSKVEGTSSRPDAQTNIQPRSMTDRHTDRHD